MNLNSRYLESATILEALACAVAIRSVSGEESQLASYVKDCLTNVGLDTEIDRHGNVVMLWAAGAGPTLALNTHMDTVPPDGSWTRDPFVPEMTDGRLYGLGAADTKGSLIGMVCALCALKDQRVRLGGRLIFAAVVAEEVPSVDAKGTVRFLRDGVQAHAGICGEPTELAVGLGCEGTLEVEARTYGRSAHACDPGKGLNAVDHMMHFLSEVNRIRVGEHPLFGRGSINIGRIEGGVKGTMVPASCRARIGRFVLPGESMDLFMRQLEAVAADLRAQDPRINLIIEPVYSSNAAVIDADHPIVESLARATEVVIGTAPMRIGVKYHADSDFMLHLNQIPTVLFGPGNIDQGHAPDEFIETAQVIEAARIYAQTIVDLLSLRPHPDADQEDNRVEGDGS